MKNLETLNTLARIQQTLKAPKGQTNSFGNYKYRSCEDIVEAIKPLLETATLTFNDSIELVGDRYYVKATVFLTDGEKVWVSTAYARESLDKKGMDSAQITGATSSYARKHALNGLFAIDDTRDADTQDNSTTVAKQPKEDNVKTFFKDILPETKTSTDI